jgi:hypothetical protein
MAMLAASVDGVIGVDTHRDTHTAAAVTNLGGVLAQTTASADAAGYRQLLGFAQTHLPDAGRRCWAVEGAGSYGAGLASFLLGRGEHVVEVGRPERPAAPAPRAARWTPSAPPVSARPGPLGNPRRRGEREALRALLTTRRSATLARVARSVSSRRCWSAPPSSCGPSCAAIPPRARSAPALACATGRPARWSTVPPSEPYGPPPSASSTCGPRRTSSRPS